MTPSDSMTSLTARLAVAADDAGLLDVAFTTVDTPVGPLLLAANDDGLRAIEFQPSRHAVKRDAGWQEIDWAECTHPLLR